MRLFKMEEQECLRTIIDRLCSAQDQWFKQKGICVGDKHPYWVLNYSAYSDKNEYNELCRGLVVRQPNFRPKAPGEIFSLVESFPFARFYNHGENRAAKVNLSCADMLEKLDGTMVGVFFPKSGPDAKNVNCPYWHTRRLICTHWPDMEMEMTGFHGHRFRMLQLIGEYIQSLTFHRLDLNYTFIFEFIHEATQVITQYSRDQWGLYLIGARNTNDFRECTEDQLDKIAERIGVKRPRRWDSINDYNIIDDMMIQASIETPNFEGFVFRDRRSYERIKIKDPKYVQKTHLIGSLSYRNLSRLVMAGETDEVLSYFPMAAERIKEINRAFEKYVEKVMTCVLPWRERFMTGLCDKKGIAEKLFNGKEAKQDAPEPFICSMIMCNLEKKDPEEVLQTVEQKLRLVCLGEGQNEGSPKKFLRMLGITANDDDLN